MIHSKMICKILAFAYVSRLSVETKMLVRLETHSKELYENSALKRSLIDEHQEYFAGILYLSIYTSK